jgi:hypothetical protein
VPEQHSDRSGVADLAGTHQRRVATGVLAIQQLADRRVAAAAMQEPQQI